MVRDMQKFGIGQSVKRVEDVRFLTGAGAFTDDLSLPGQAYGFMLRSPWAHAEIKSFDVEAAKAAPGVLAVITGEDLAAAGVASLPCVMAAIVKNRDGSPIVNIGRPVLAHHVAMHVGDGIAFVVAETLEQAKDAAELIEVDAEELPAAANLADTIKPDAPTLYEEAPGNISFDWQGGDPDLVDEAFARAAHVTRLTISHNRLAPSTIEPRASLGEYTAEGRYVLRTATQGAHRFQDVIAPVLGIDKEQLRVFTADVGGAFGMKEFIYPEHILSLFAARQAGRPVRWTADRSESFLSDLHGRDVISEAELAFDADNRATALRVHNKANMGAYLSLFGPAIQTLAGARLTGGVYAIPAISIAVTAYFSNAVPVDAYRGAGRPEAAFVIERLMDKAARELGLGRDEIRRLNFIRPGAMPYSHPLGFVYDSGDFAANMDDAMERTDWSDFEARRAEAVAKGMLRGIGLSTYIESTDGFGTEAAEIKFLEDGTVEIITGTQAAGQGHETVWAQLVSAQLGVPFEAMRLVQGDTDRVKSGEGTAGSHSSYMAAGAFRATSEVVIEKGKALAAILLDEDVDIIAFDDGMFRAEGTNKALGIMEVAEAARDIANLELPENLRALLADGLDSGATFEYRNSTFPNGCHICEVEIDPETGSLEIVGYTAVDDFGRVINPMIVDGQVHGGIAQGLGQALMEQALHDPETGQLITGSFMDYAMPRADDLKTLDLSYNEVLCTTSPYGIKGCGEAGTTGASPAIISAVIDALSPLGIEHIDMPATPLKIWTAIQNARETV